MMKRLFTLALTLCCAVNAFGWGQKGHDVVAYIAECHLTPTAAARVSEVLGGRSLVYYANWMDNASHTPQYAYTKTWHYMNIDEGETLETQPRHPKGDVLTAEARELFNHHKIPSVEVKVTDGGGRLICCVTGVAYRKSAEMPVDSLM